jgi:SAM-dependent methyltransferase
MRNPKVLPDRRLSGRRIQPTLAQQPFSPNHWSSAAEAPPAPDQESTVTSYDTAFYARQMSGSYASARVVVPLVRSLLPVGSVCDVGCGAGTWLRAWAEQGVDDIVGLDGDYALPMLQIPRDAFRAVDLRQPISLGRRFDLAMSVEVAEHLPPARSESFVDDLIRLAPVVLFSAAIPLQGGTDHVNERWQAEWAVIFKARGYLPCDVIRPSIWNERGVETWYKQNILLFVQEHHLEKHPALSRQPAFPLSVVHPDSFSGGVSFGRLDSKRQILQLLYWSLARDLRRFRLQFGHATPKPGG